MKSLSISEWQKICPKFICGTDVLKYQLAVMAELRAQKKKGYATYCHGLNIGEEIRRLRSQVEKIKKDRRQGPLSKAACASQTKRRKARIVKEDLYTLMTLLAQLQDERKGKPVGKSETPCLNPIVPTIPVVSGVDRSFAAGD